MISAERLALIRSVARRRASLLKGGLVEVGDLENEAIVRALAGRQSNDGPMQDLMRRQGWMKNYRSGNSNHRQYDLQRVALNSKRPHKVIKAPRPARAIPDVERAVSRLTVRYIMVLRMRYWYGMEQKAIGRAMGFGESRANAIEKSAIKQLKEALL